MQYWAQLQTTNISCGLSDCFFAAASPADCDLHHANHPGDEAAAAVKQTASVPAALEADCAADARRVGGDSARDCGGPNCRLGGTGRGFSVGVRGSRRSLMTVGRRQGFRSHRGCGSGRRGRCQGLRRQSAGTRPSCDGRQRIHLSGAVLTARGTRRGTRPTHVPPFIGSRFDQLGAEQM